MDWPTFIAAFGLGSLVSLIAQALLSHMQNVKIRRFEERKSAYIGLWEAFLRQGQQYDEQSKFDVGHWIFRCELVASKAVCDCLDVWNNLDPEQPDRPRATKALKSAMRDDLGIAK